MSRIPPPIQFPRPLLGFAAYSGTGKTTLLLKLLPLLKDTGLRVGMVKHAHHDFEIDYPGKDSYELRAAGADEMLIAGRCRVAWVHECGDRPEEPTLADTLALLNPSRLDLVLVEGFKQAPFPKIELHRPALGLPLIFPRDSNVVAIACDAPPRQDPGALPLLDLNDPQRISAFVLQFCGFAHDGNQGLRA
jgi:molybdopterin-guanine dinucleotide biosynthesis protein MobB